MKQTNIITTLALSLLSLFSYAKDNELSFTENKGQVTDQFYKSRPDVLFSGSDHGMVFHLKNNGISYQLYKDGNSQKHLNVLETEAHAKMEIYRLDINWLNSNSTRNISYGNASSDFMNYYFESCPHGALNVKSYYSIVYNNIYEGIDLKWYSKDDHLKYDYIINPGADYKKIQFEINGSESIKVNELGELVIKTPFGCIVENAPLVIQENKVLKSNWKVTGNIVSFYIEGYNPSQPFTIDPAVRSWGTYYGEVGDEAINSCITDSNGDVYITGYSNTSVGTNIATVGSHQSTYGGGTRDAFLAKFNSVGVRQWATYYGGTLRDEGRSCAVDLSGNVFMAGETGSSSGISTVGSHQQNFGGATRDAFLVKFDANGARIWGTYFGGANDDFGYSCITASSGDVVMAGYTASTNGTFAIASFGSHQINYGGGSSDAFLVKFNSAGVRQWGTFYGGSGNDWGYSAKIDASGNVYLVGNSATSSGTSIATVGSFQSTYGGGSSQGDAYIAKFNSSGVRQWGTYYGGAGNELGNSCALDASDNIYVVGQTASTGTLLATPGSHKPVNASSSSEDAFLVKFDPSGIRQWGTYYGGYGSDRAESCVIDAMGNIFMSGFTTTTTGDSIATAGSHQSTHAMGTYDGFLVKFNSLGARQWGTYYGGTNLDFVYECAVSSSGAIYIAGSTTSSNLNTIATTGCHQVNYYGGGEGFLVQFNDCNGPVSPINTTPVQNQNICISVTNTTTLTASAGSAISWFSSLTSTTVIGTGTVFVTPTLSVGAQTFYASTTNTCSESPRTAFLVNVNSSPTISVSSGSICLGQSFTMTPTGAFTYTYSSGTSIVSPTINTSYTVTGTSASGCINNTGTVLTVTVNSLPTITSNATPSTTLCIGNNVTLTGVGASTYTWSNGVTNATAFTPTASATYTVTGTNANGCTNTSTKSIVVNNLPTITSNATPSATLCIGNNVTLTGLGASTYTWSNGITNATAFTPTASATYTVTGTDVNGCTNTSTKSITVNSLPTVTSNAAPSATLCAGDNVTLNGVGATTYTWSNGITNATAFTPTTSATYIVTGTDANGCTNTSTKSITVNNLPTVTSNATPSATVCTGNCTIIDIIATGGTPTYIYSWMPGGITTSSIGVCPTGPVVFTCTVTDANGCTNSIAQTISANPLPSITSNSTPSSTICAGINITLTGSGASSYTWTGGVIDNVAFTPSSTIYTVTGTDANGCSNTSTQNISVNNLPTVSYVQNPTTVCVNATSVVLSTATPTGGVFSGTAVTGSSFNATMAGAGTHTITYTYTDANSCVNSSTQNIYVDLCTGIIETVKDNFSIYPNPSNGVFTIQSNQLIQSIKVYNVIGEIILSNSPNTLQALVDLSNQSNGVYFIKINNTITRVVKN